MYLFLDESQDTRHFVVAAVGAPELLTLHDVVGDIRTAARRLRVVTSEFKEKEWHRDHPRLLNQAIELLTRVRRRKGRLPRLRTDVQISIAYYRKRGPEQETDGLSKDRLAVVYRACVLGLLTDAYRQWPPVVTVADTFQLARQLEPELQQAHQEFYGSGRFIFAQSSQERPLQLADLVAGTARRYCAGEPNEGRFERVVPLIDRFIEVQT